MEMTKEIADAMKQNERAFCFWPKEWQEWARENWNEFERLVPSGQFHAMHCDVMESDYADACNDFIQADGVPDSSPAPCSEWVECWKCSGEGFSHHDCGEDSCCCSNPELNVPCDICQGEGGWIRVPNARLDRQEEAR